MITLKLDARSKGFWKLYLKSKDPKGYTIKCFGKHRNYFFNNVHDFRWIYGGNVVFMKSNHHEYERTAYDLSGWDRVEIEETTEIATQLLTIEKF